MTEQEAKELINYINEEYFYYDKEGEFDEINEALDMAISALEEIQQYRALGTVEKLKVPKKLEIGNDNGNPRKCCARCKCFVLPASRYCSKCGQALLWE